LDVRKIAQLKDGDEAYGNRVKVKVVKNKVAPPFKNCEYDIVFGEGIDKIGELVEIASNLGIIKKAGAWYSYNESKLGQGKEAAKQLLKDNEPLLKEIEKLTKEELKKR
jgi:recombination protein RecA